MPRAGVFQAIFSGWCRGSRSFCRSPVRGISCSGSIFSGMDQDRFGLIVRCGDPHGYVLAVVSYFWRDLMRMAWRSLRSSSQGPDFADPDQRWRIFLVASHSGGRRRVLFENFFERTVRSPWLVAFNLVLVGVLFIVGEAVGRKTRTSDKLGSRRRWGSGWPRRRPSFPGVSRSGATITLGLFLGLRREEAARFSFLMSVPIIAAAALLSLVEVLGSGIDSRECSSSWSASSPRGSSGTWR